MPHYCVEPGCNKAPSFNYPGTTSRIYCAEHHLNGMVNVAAKKCKTPDCDKFAQVDGFCRKCVRRQGWDGVFNPCKKCGKNDARINGLCRSCYNKLQGIYNGSPSEKRLYNFLQNKFPELDFGTEVGILSYKVDFLCELNGSFIMIANDENAHRNKWNSLYTKEDERLRQNKIYDYLSAKKRTVIIRFNCGKKNITEEEIDRRQNALENLISYCLFDENISGIFYLFYDE